jgi:proteasome-associated ATPase
MRRNRSESSLDPFSNDIEPQSDEARARAVAVIDEILRVTPRADPRLERLLHLRQQLLADERQMEEVRTALGEYEDAYNRLTAPANRLGVLMELLDEGERALIALGDQEYLVAVDGSVEREQLVTGASVLLNEAYTVVGVRGFSADGGYARVSEVLDDGRLRVTYDGQGSSGHVAFRAASLANETIRTGDEVRLEPNHKVAIEIARPADRKEFYLEDVPEIPWSQVGGQEQAIEVIKDAIELPMLHPELFARFEKRPLKGILLYGPPGCGKTLIGKATAYNLTKEYGKHAGRDVQHCFMVLSGPKILNMWLGETERMVREIFSTARQKAKDGYLVFLFIDEAESILRTRSSGKWLNISNTVVPQFCAEMDGLVSLDNVVVILTSNRPDYIDPAILRPERIDRKVKVARPGQKASRDILGIYLHPGIPVDPDLVRQHKGDAAAAREELLDEAIACLWQRTDETKFLEVYLRSGSVEALHWHDLVSGALLKSVIERAKDSAIKRSIALRSDAEGITADDLRSAVRTEYKENEIFPKSDTLEDWLKLLDHEPENVATVKPVGAGRREAPTRRNII